MCFTKYYKNFILCGAADHHCLLCDETLHQLDDIEKHIRWENHRKAIKVQTILHKFKNDGIFKIESYYYCQYCNFVAYKISSLKDHINTEEHICNKTTPEVKHKKVTANYNSGTVVINEIKIKSHQWHGIQNNFCLICNTEVTNILTHIGTQAHIISLIQTETKCDNDKCYRKINKTTYQCFNCMKTFPTEDFDSHWQQVNKNTVEPQIVTRDTKHQIGIYSQDQYKKLGDREYEVSKLAIIQDEFYNIDVKNKEITCKQCKLTVRNTKNDLENHLINKHETNGASKSNIVKQINEELEKEYILIYEIDAGKDRHELAIYAKDNYIKLNAGGSEADIAICTLCNRFLSAQINIFKQHVGGSVHSCHLAIKGQTNAEKHKKGLTISEPFSRHLLQLKYTTDLDDVAVNMSFCNDRDSFLHCETKTHQAHVMAAKVEIEDLNFIREIKPKIYHCGVCNMTLPFWETLERHIDDRSHKTKVMGKHFVTAIKFYQNQHWTLPESKKFELNSNNYVLYSNILKVLYEKRLNTLRMYLDYHLE